MVSMVAPLPQVLHPFGGFVEAQPSRHQLPFQCWVVMTVPPVMA